MKTFFPVLLICLLLLGCTDSNSSKEQRIKELSQYQPKDEFMALFMTNLKKNNLLKYAVEYESILLDKKELADVDEASYRNYLGSIAETDQRCLPREIKDSLYNSFFANSGFEQYHLLVATGKMPNTKEYTFLLYLSQAGAPEMQGALEYALMNNELTEDKRIFYLVCTAPFKVCE